MADLRESSEFGDMQPVLTETRILALSQRIDTVDEARAEQALQAIRLAQAEGGRATDLFKAISGVLLKAVDVVL